MDKQRRASQRWIAATLSIILSALVLDPVAHEPRLTDQIGTDSRAGLHVAQRGLRAGTGEVLGVAVKVGRILTRVQWGARR